MGRGSAALQGSTSLRARILNLHELRSYRGINTDNSCDREKGCVQTVVKWDDKSTPSIRFLFASGKPFTDPMMKAFGGQ